MTQVVCNFKFKMPIIMRRHSKCCRNSPRRRRNMCNHWTETHAQRGHRLQANRKRAETKHYAGGEIIRYLIKSTSFRYSIYWPLDKFIHCTCRGKQWAVITAMHINRRNVDPYSSISRIQDAQQYRRNRQFAENRWRAQTANTKNVK